MKHHPAFGIAVLVVALLVLTSLPCSAVVYAKSDSPGPEDGMMCFRCHWHESCTRGM